MWNCCRSWKKFLWWPFVFMTTVKNHQTSLFSCRKVIWPKYDKNSQLPVWSINNSKHFVNSIQIDELWLDFVQSEFCYFRAKILVSSAKIPRRSKGWKLTSMWVLITCLNFKCFELHSLSAGRRSEKFRVCKRSLKE